MAQIEIRIPQLGEGLQEARLVRFLKEPGETVERDEPIYEMETDKAVMEIESPAAGVLSEWSAKPDDVLPIGAVIGTIETEATADGGRLTADDRRLTADGGRSPAVGEDETSNADPYGMTSSAAPAPVSVAPARSLVDICIPQLGEGLQEARIVRFLKAPGEAVQRDEPIYEMETDKAVMEIESPAAGVLEAWSAKEDDVLAIGAKIGAIRTESAVDIAGGSSLLVSEAPIPAPDAGSSEGEAEAETNSVEPGPHYDSAAEGALRNRDVSPRIRAYAFKQGVTEGQLLSLARNASARLTKEDIDQFLAQGGSPSSAAKKPVKEAAAAFTEFQLSGRQRTFNFRLQRSAQMVIPATMEMAVDWSRVEAARARLKAEKGDAAPSQFILFAWSVVQAAKGHPRLLCALVNETTVRQYEHLHLGIAVARPEDELLMARVADATALSFQDFTSNAQESIQRARDGIDQSSDAMQLSLTSMAGVGITLGIPVVVSPSVATLFIGASYNEPFPIAGGGVGFRRMAKMVLTFDHRLMNGVGAARFLSDVRKHVEELT